MLQLALSAQNSMRLDGQAFRANSLNYSVGRRLKIVFSQAFIFHLAQI